MAADGIGKGLKQGGGLADPVGQCRAVKVEPFAAEDLALAIKRQVICVFVDQNMGQKARPRAAPLDGARRQRRLDEAFAARTGEPGTNDAVHDEASGDIFQLFRHVLANPAQAAAAIGTSVGPWGQLHFHPGDVVRDRAALGFVLLLDVRQLHPRGHGRRRNLAGLKCQLKLFCRLRRRAKPVRPMPGQLMAKLLDQDRLRLDLGQKPRGEAAQLLRVFGQGQGLIQHARSLSHCIRCGNH